MDTPETYAPKSVRESVILAGGGGSGGPQSVPEPIVGVHETVRKTLVDDYGRMQRIITNLTAQVHELSVDREALLRENDMLRTQHAELARQFQRMQAYAVRVTTQLDGVVQATSLLINQAEDLQRVVTSVQSEAEHKSRSLFQEQPEQEQERQDAAASYSESSQLAPTTSPDIAAALARLPANVLIHDEDPRAGT